MRWDQGGVSSRTRYFPPVKRFCESSQGPGVARFSHLAGRRFPLSLSRALSRPQLVSTHTCRPGGRTWDPPSLSWFLSLRRTRGDSPARGTRPDVPTTRPPHALPTPPTDGCRGDTMDRLSSGRRIVLNHAAVDEFPKIRTCGEMSNLALAIKTREGMEKPSRLQKEEGPHAETRGVDLLLPLGVSWPQPPSSS